MAIRTTISLGLAGCVAAALLAGCAADKPPPREVNLSGYSTEFKQGYSDGCDSARGRGQRRDEARYRDDTHYMMGWNDGYSVCGKKRR